VQVSRENARKAQVADRAQFVQGDVLLTDFSKASVVTIYLLPDLMDQLQSRFIDQLAPGTRIVSHSFRMAGWRADRSETMKVTKPHAGQGDESTLYLWIVPANVRGLWTLDGRRVQIDQDRQQIDVEGASEARLSGADISWRWPQGRFRGRVTGDRIVGELDGKPVQLERRYITFPGFISPSGSSARLIERISSSSSGSLCARISSRLSCPRPCSAEIEPSSSATTS
jgi:hypothetical protein